MSRPVKNLRFMGTAGKTKGTPPVSGASKAYGAKTQQDGRANLGAGEIVSASKPRFQGDTRLIQSNKYDSPA